MHLDGGNAPDGCLVREPKGLGKTVKDAVSRVRKSVPNLAQLLILEIGPRACICAADPPHHGRPVTGASIWNS